jgi:hypothetical protein
VTTTITGTQTAVARCRHNPTCPPAEASNRESALTLVCYPEQGWSLLCNGVVLFDDTGELLPDGGVVLPRRPTDPGQGTSAA